jgi:hypothetical protein
MHILTAATKPSVQKHMCILCNLVPRNNGLTITGGTAHFSCPKISWNIDRKTKVLRLTAAKVVLDKRQ